MTYRATSKTGTQGFYVGTTKVVPPSAEPGSTFARFFSGSGDRIVGQPSSVLGQDFMVMLTFWRANTVTTPDNYASQRLFTQYSNSPYDTRIAVGINRGYLTVVAEIRQNVLSPPTALRVIETDVLLNDTNKHRLLLWVKNNAAPREYALLLDGREVWHYRPQFSYSSEMLPVPGAARISFGSDGNNRFFHGYMDDIVIYDGSGVPSAPPAAWIRHLSSVADQSVSRAYSGAPFRYYADAITSPAFAEAGLTAPDGYQLRNQQGEDYPDARAALAVPFENGTQFPVQGVEFKIFPGWAPNLVKLAVGCTQDPTGSFLASKLGEDASSFAYLPDGRFRVGNATVASGLPTWGFLDRVGIRCTLATGQMEFMVNGAVAHTYTPPAAGWYPAVQYGNNEVILYSGTRAMKHLPEAPGVPWTIKSSITTEFLYSRLADLSATLQDTNTTVLNSLTNTSAGTYVSPDFSGAGVTGEPWDFGRLVGGSITLTSQSYSVAAATGFFFGVAFSPVASDLVGTRVLLECGAKWGIRIVSGSLQGWVAGLTVSIPAGMLTAGGRYYAAIERTASGRLRLWLSGGGVAQSTALIVNQTAGAVTVGADAGGSSKFAGVLGHVLMRPTTIPAWKLARLAAAAAWTVPPMLALTGEFTVTSPTLSGSLEIFGGTGPYSVATISGTPPPGIAFSVVGNRITATGPTTTPGDYTWVFEVSDTTGLTAQLQVNIGDLRLFWRPELVSSAVVLADDTTTLTEVSGQAAQWNTSVGAWHWTNTNVAPRPQVLPTGLNGLRVLRFDPAQQDVMFLSATAARDIGRNKAAIWCFCVMRIHTPLALNANLVPLIVHTNAADTRFGLGVVQLPEGLAYRLGGRRISGDTYTQIVDTPYADSASWHMVFGYINYQSGAGALILNGGTHTVRTGWLANPGGPVENSAGARSPSIGGNSSTTAANPTSANNTPMELAAVTIGDGTVPSQTEIDKMFGWAAHRYALTALLPVAHPYKNSPPTL